MIRRPASRNTDGAPGYVIAGLIKVGADGNQTYSFVFEATTPGTVSEEPSANIKFTDGSPAVIPTL